MKIQHQDRWRSFFATLCLVAVMLLYAPLAGAAWSLYSVACCTSGQCLIQGHHHQHSPVSSRNPMDCGHEMPGRSRCSISCCHNPDRTAIALLVFVLPPEITVSEPCLLKSSITLSKPSNDLHSIEPLSPPPRLFSAAA
jgi:hypothetical protein